MIIRVGTGQPQSEGNLYFYTVTTPPGIQGQGQGQGQGHGQGQGQEMDTMPICTVLHIGVHIVCTVEQETQYNKTNYSN